MLSYTKGAKETREEEVEGLQGISLCKINKVKWKLKELDGLGSHEKESV